MEIHTSKLILLAIVAEFEHVSGQPKCGPTGEYPQVSVPQKDVVCVLVGMMSIVLAVAEDEECFEQRGIGGGIARTSSMLRWLKAWDSFIKCRKTHRLLPSVSKWT